jgi:hypothetical protein
LDRLQKLLGTSRQYFRENPDAAKLLLSEYPLKIDESINPQELASWAMLTSALLNLDEFLTRP